MLGTFPKRQPSAGDVDIVHMKVGCREHNPPSCLFLACSGNISRSPRLGATTAVDLTVPSASILDSVIHQTHLDGAAPSLSRSCQISSKAKRKAYILVTTCLHVLCQ